MQRGILLPSPEWPEIEASELCEQLLIGSLVADEVVEHYLADETTPPLPTRSQLELALEIALAGIYARDELVASERLRLELALRLWTPALADADFTSRDAPGTSTFQSRNREIVAAEVAERACWTRSQAPGRRKRPSGLSLGRTHAA